MGWTITREHEICAGHRVYGHESKCRYIHGHQYKFELTVATKPECGDLDELGRVIDFSVIKDRLCNWLDEHWDHRLLLWRKDPIGSAIVNYSEYLPSEGVVFLPCNPTVENLAEYFVENIAPGLLIDTPVYLKAVRLWETSKCSCYYERKEYESSNATSRSTVGDVDYQRSTR